MHWRPVLGGLVFAAILQVSRAGQPAPQVLLVQPSAAQVPANLLRLSIVFAAPVEGPVLPRMKLSGADGRAILEPFLQQELWSPDGKVLTLLLHPGRVKTGLVAREQWGPILSDADNIVLALDGLPIKQWRVGPADPNGPDISVWTLSPVNEGSRQPLVVTLDGPIDGRDLNYLVIVGAGDRLINGQSQLGEGETTWTFTPDAAWRAGKYRLLVRGTLEDPSGNRLGGRFATPIGSPQPPSVDAVIAFTVDASALAR